MAELSNASGFVPLFVVGLLKASKTPMREPGPLPPHIRRLKAGTTMVPPPVTMKTLHEQADRFRSLLKEICTTYPRQTWDDATVSLHRLRDAGMSLDFLVSFTGDPAKELKKRLIARNKLGPSSAGLPQAKCPRTDCLQILELDDVHVPMHLNKIGKPCRMTGVRV
ncbi:hypothetical protein [Streptacidiphilus albus]|uniref:hypothetical protein n=1 Tax=Streptacidiphilus albus TaxID=105425 RepID=UPI00128CD871|nr:hypothetical protein [Streptacidiphilus albus]